MAEVLIAHTKDKPEHEHLFRDLPLEVQTDVVDSTVQTISSSPTSENEKRPVTETLESVTTLQFHSEPTESSPLPIVSAQEESTTNQAVTQRKKRSADAGSNNERLTKIRRPKLKTISTPAKKSRKELNSEVTKKPEPIPISLDEVAGFQEIIKKKIKQDD